jgi:hypothetical protein
MGAGSLAVVLDALSDSSSGALVYFFLHGSTTDLRDESRKKAPAAREVLNES